ncbi:hypothetical protein EIP91_006552 [Steccherinum ochraceum]|uniref:Uncharacterized protein n=1 Tax=Steccherinum ochraceum TaxID=92696 RepID=A0A4R0R8A0_9APHY|nr:hypothetical protein EIP91_006552 [Steccherinum ochraceum]
MRNTRWRESSLPRAVVGPPQDSEAALEVLVLCVAATSGLHSAYAPSIAFRRASIPETPFSPKGELYLHIIKILLLKVNAGSQSNALALLCAHAGA